MGDSDRAPLGTAPAEPASDQRTLLIVDEDETLRRRLARAMEQWGFAVTSAERLAEGIAAARALSSPP